MADLLSPVDCLFTQPLPTSGGEVAAAFDLSFPDPPPAPVFAECCRRELEGGLSGVPGHLARALPRSLLPPRDPDLPLPFQKEKLSLWTLLRREDTLWGPLGSQEAAWGTRLAGGQGAGFPLLQSALCPRGWNR